MRNLYYGLKVALSQSSQVKHTPTPDLVDELDYIFEISSHKGKYFKVNGGNTCQNGQYRCQSGQKL